MINYQLAKARQDELLQAAAHHRLATQASRARAAPRARATRWRRQRGAWWPFARAGSFPDPPIAR